jgi:PKHD-type hydroxylase
MTNFYQRSLLTGDELAEIRQLLNTANWSNSESTLREYLGAHQTNSEMSIGQQKSRISEITMNAISRDTGFRDFVFPKHSTNVIVSRTEVGQGFKTHHDSPSNGDYSTTVFLSNPDTYSGGELTMFLNGEERKFALSAGDALTYDTGVPHCVKEVTKGVRYAIVFWTTSLVREGYWREILTDLRRAKNLLPRDYSYNLLDTTNDPHFIIQGIENKITRYLLNR